MATAQIAVFAFEYPLRKMYAPTIPNIVLDKPKNRQRLTNIF
jgi:hypothetical protein